jgi:DNA modification methylase
MGKKQTIQQNGLFPSEVHQMPDGYYSGDQPNPNLRAFVEAHLAERPYDPEHDDYDVPAFNKPIETTKATAIYNMHTYWSKKPHDAIRQYIEHYTQPGDLVLDPLCGSGSTALAALMAGRKAIGIDRSPAATFITKNYCTPVDVIALKQAFEELKQKVKPEIDWLYETRCDRCDGPAATAYTVYSQVFQCPRCLEKVPLFDCVTIEGKTAEGKAKKVNVCPHCYERGFEEVIRSQSQKFGAVAVLVSYICQGKCKPSRSERRHNDSELKKREYFERYDLGKLQEIEAKPIPYWYPQGYSMQGFSRYQRDALYYYGVKEVVDLFTKRNLWALATILQACKNLELSSALLFVFESNVLSGTTMQQYREGGGGFAKGTYYIPQTFIEREQLGCFTRKFNDAISGQIELQRNLQTTCIAISTQSSTDLSALPSNSVDYIFTDPPYADKVQYGELNFVWEAWLGLDTYWHNDEIIVNEVRGKSEADWTAMMKQAMAECYRVLKPGRWLSLCYHDTSAGTWSLVQDIMAEVDFVADTSESALFIDTGQKSYNQLTADKVTKRDLVINFRKPKLHELATVTISGDEDETTFAEKVHAIIHDYLLAHPGATKDRIYDEVVSRMVRSRQMEAHNFDALLRQVAEPASDDQTRWFLQHGDETKIDAAESAKEEKAAQVIGNFIALWLRQHPEQEGVHYSDIFEHYLYAVKDKPRRQLNDWLQDYFYTTSAGTYRLPATEEEQAAKSQGRQEGTNRRIKRYLAHIQQNLAIPAAERPGNAILVEWIRHCRRSNLYEQGRLLFEKGGLDLDQLSEEQQVEVEEDYQICVRRIQTSMKEKKQKTLFDEI